MEFVGIPIWDIDHVWSSTDINQANEECQNFYRKVFVPSFFNNKPIEIPIETIGYAFNLLFDLPNFFSSVTMKDKLYDSIVNLGLFYPKVEEHCKRKLLDLFDVDFLYKKTRKNNEIVPEFFNNIGISEAFLKKLLKEQNKDFKGDWINNFTNKEEIYYKILSFYKGVKAFLATQNPEVLSFIKNFASTIASKNNGWYGCYNNVISKIEKCIFVMCENEVRTEHNVKRLPKPSISRMLYYVSKEEKEKINVFFTETISQVVKLLSPIDYEDKCNKIIYAYKHIDVASHVGWIKIGETRKKPEKRVSKQNEADNVRCEILYTTDAMLNNGTEISDKDIHLVLEKLGYEREAKHNMWGIKTNTKSEWFRIELCELIKIIENIKENGVYQYLK